MRKTKAIRLSAKPILLFAYIPSRVGNGSFNDRRGNISSARSGKAKTKLREPSWKKLGAGG